MARRKRICLGCKYDLRGLDTPRCPECGRPFDPDDPTTTGPVPWHRRPWEPWVALACCGFCAAHEYAGLFDPVVPWKQAPATGTDFFGAIVAVPVLIGLTMSSLRRKRWLRGFVCFACLLAVIAEYLPSVLRLIEFATLY